MGLRQATPEEIQKIKGTTTGGTQATPVSGGTNVQAPAASASHQKYGSLRSASPVEAQVNDPAMQKSGAGSLGKVKGGIVGELFTGSTQRFGKTIGESLSAGQNVEDYSAALQSSDELAFKLSKAIQEGKAAGRDVSRLEKTLAEHNASKPQLNSFTGDSLDKKAGQVIGEAVGTGLEVLTGGLASGASNAIKAPTALGKIGTAAKAGAGYGAAGGFSQGLQQGKDAGGVALSTLGGAAAGGALGGALAGVGAAGSKLVNSIPTSGGIMNRVTRTTPTRQTKFQQLAGKSQGEYLAERGIFGDEVSVMDQLGKWFQHSKQTADDAIASLDGLYKRQEVANAIDELVERELRVSAPSAPSRDMRRAIELKNKHDTVGLTMSEINEAKRMYERNVKLDFVKQNLPEQVARANNIDNALRSWQFSEAEKLGLKNLPNINKETQLSKQLLDDLGKTYSGREGNDLIGLSDWMVLSPGDPISMAAFATKKTFSNKGVQGGIARMMSKPPTVGKPVAEFGGKTGLPALIPGRNYGASIQIPPSNTPYKMRYPGSQ